MTERTPDDLRSALLGALDGAAGRPAGGALDRRPVGVVVSPTADALNRETSEAIVACLARNGVPVERLPGLDAPTEATIVLGAGFPGYLLGGRGSAAGAGYVAGNAASMDGRAPRRVIWMGEALPVPQNPGGPGPAAARALGGSRLVELLRGPLRRLVRVPLPGPLARLRNATMAERERASNLRALGLLAGAADLVAVTSRDRAEALRAAALDAVAIPFGYEPSVAGPLAAPDAARGIALLAIGHVSVRRAGRRAEVTRRWQALEPRLRVVEGVWGEPRNELLRGARVVIDAHRVPGNFIGVRLVLALAAGAVVVTEPMPDPYPFVPGVHYVEAPLPELLSVARALLADEPRRRSIAEAGQELLRGELSMEWSLARLFTALGERSDASGRPGAT